MKAKLGKLRLIYMSGNVFDIMFDHKLQTSWKIYFRTFIFQSLIHIHIWEMNIYEMNIFHSVLLSDWQLNYTESSTDTILKNHFSPCYSDMNSDPLIHPSSKTINTMTWNVRSGSCHACHSRSVVLWLDFNPRKTFILASWVLLERWENVDATVMEYLCECFSIRQCVLWDDLNNS